MKRLLMGGSFANTLTFSPYAEVREHATYGIIKVYPK